MISCTGSIRSIFLSKASSSLCMLAISLMPTSSGSGEGSRSSSLNFFSSSDTSGWKGVNTCFGSSVLLSSSAAFVYCLCCYLGGEGLLFKASVASNLWLMIARSMSWFSKFKFLPSFAKAGFAGGSRSFLMKSSRLTYGDSCFCFCRDFFDCFDGEACC